MGIDTGKLPKNTGDPGERRIGFRALMHDHPEFELAPLFRAVGDVMGRNRERLNQADSYNGNHGDHMLAIFRIATQAAEGKGVEGLAEAMGYAARLLEGQAHNGSAQVYAQGLKQMAAQLRKYGVGLNDLVSYVRSALAKDGEAGRTSMEETSPEASGEVLKAILAGLAGWRRAVPGGVQSEDALDMGALFEFGMAYLQAKQRGGSRIKVLADAAASVSPLGEVPHRYESGKMAIQALLGAMQADRSGLPVGDDL